MHPGAKFAQEGKRQRERQNHRGKQQGDPIGKIDESVGDIGQLERVPDVAVTRAEGAAVECVVVESEPDRTGDAAGQEEPETAPVESDQDQEGGQHDRISRAHDHGHREGRAADERPARGPPTAEGGQHGGKDPSSGEGVADRLDRGEDEDRARAQHRGPGGGGDGAQAKLAGGQVAQAERAERPRELDQERSKLPTEDLGRGGEVQRQAHGIRGGQGLVIEKILKAERREIKPVLPGLRAKFRRDAQSTLKLAVREQPCAVDVAGGIGAAGGRRGVAGEENSVQAQRDEKQDAQQAGGRGGSGESSGGWGIRI
jgi:hypothetical protein